MKIKITSFLCLLLSPFAFCQTTFIVADFSEDYMGKVHIADTSEVFSPGWVAIIDKQTKKELIKIDSEELTFDLDNGLVEANIKELPYGKQSSILYEDYNFDGVKDFAIMDGQNSCYHGPSFQIYLATDNGFLFSPDFTQLSQEYCGMFAIDPATKTISTMTKSGCCWHQFSEFKVANNVPYPVKIVEEGMSASGMTWDYIEENWVDGKMVKSEYQTLAFEIEADDLILAFEFKNKKKMQLFTTEELLFYVFTDSEKAIELFYEGTFKYSKTENSITFFNHNTEYVIYDDKIIVKTPSKTFEMKSVSNTKIGSLSKLKKMSLENVH
ncbi:hypothetical protein [Flavobacterium sp. J27]|uniref:XAC2610-related protein n=1 Tax=Flavobacterium sp. J27 TaxID=2060419 RepID=UPI001031CFF7|nr:hypothetical protein [Flavobacterium sp. J27]